MRYLFLLRAVLLPTVLSTVAAANTQEEAHMFLCASNATTASSHRQLTSNQGFFNPNIYYLVEKGESGKYVKATNEPQHTSTIWDNFRKTKAASTNADTRRTNKFFHWRFVYIGDAGNGEGLYEMINRGTGRKAGFQQQGPHIGGPWFVTFTKATGSKRVKIRALTAGPRKFKIFAEYGGGLYAGLDFNSNDYITADSTDQESRVFRFTALTDYIPVDEKGVVPIPLLNTHTSMKQMTRDFVANSITYYTYSQNFHVSTAASIAIIAFNEGFPDNSQAEILKHFAKEMHERTRVMITDSQAEQNVQRASDLITANSENYLRSWANTAKEYFSEATPEIDGIRFDLLGSLEGIIDAMHLAIAEKLIDFEYDASDDVTVAASRDGFPLLKLAVSEALGMILDYMAVKSYVEYMTDPAIGDTGCKMPDDTAS
ncbi:expressed unknown protein [Seminavis robusta]|uniref:Uncharacterized protein n=1 Tax=Seminavis robusta TaxID=568900 RepID=A0A9N8HM09_9STRA|nr:expressed unknown protein [Seminavis robusta]|eukprot:Sro1074_g238240.1 n/a (429) ;mRNA; r:699-2901